MKTNHFEKKIIWAIDPFEEALKSKTQLIATLEQISIQQEIAVEPVHVLNLAQEKEINSKPIPSQLSQYKDAAEKTAKEALQDIKGIQLLPPTILIVEDSSTKKMVQALIDYASATKALLIVVGTHARQGLPRLILGSFAETLLSSSSLPVITIGPKCAHQNRPHKNQILFATNFDNSSAFAYSSVLKFAKSMDAEITLFHVMSYGIEPVIQSGTYLIGGGWVPIPNYVSKKEDLRLKLADQWASEAKEQGVKVNVHFESGTAPISELILKHAKNQNVGWIAMVAESGSVSAALIGSTTRQVVREAHCPVWAFYRKNPPCSVRT